MSFPDWAQISPRRREHVQRVATLCQTWGEQMGVSEQELERWHRAVTLHDALKSASKKELLEIVPDAWEAPALLHGPAAARRAAADGERDRGVLDAVHYHSIGYAGWEMVGQILYLADFLEPGRSFHTAAHESLAEAVPSDTVGVLRMVARERVAGTVMVGKALLPETVEFWNSLAHTSR